MPKNEILFFKVTALSKKFDCSLSFKSLVIYLSSEKKSTFFWSINPPYLPSSVSNFAILSSKRSQKSSCFFLISSISKLPTFILPWNSFYSSSSLSYSDTSKSLHTFKFNKRSSFSLTP